MPKIKVGINFLHNHRQQESLKYIDESHVIVDRKDWDEVVEFFQNPKNLQLLEEFKKAVLA